MANFIIFFNNDVIIEIETIDCISGYSSLYLVHKQITNIF